MAGKKSPQAIDARILATIKDVDEGAFLYPQSFAPSVAAKL
jgi:hypothetical protein